MMASTSQTARGVDDEAFCLATAAPTSGDGWTSFYVAVVMIFAFVFLLGWLVRDALGRPAVEQAWPRRSATQRAAQTKSQTKCTYDDVKPRFTPLCYRDQGVLVD